jgi:hypothetical protein
MKDIKKVFLLIILINVPTLVSSQGFDWSDESKEEFSSFPELEITRDITPVRYSLEKYLPPTLSQGKTGMCVAYSLSYCRTILYAKNKNLSHEKDIVRNTFSPFFIYNMCMPSNNSNCMKGLDPLRSLHNLKKYGIAQLFNVEYPNFYPFTENRLMCDGYPTSFENDLANASIYKIDGYEKVTTVVQIKESIAKGNPIFFGFSPLPASWHTLWEKDSWNPNDMFFCFHKEYECDIRTNDVSGLCKNHKPTNWNPEGGHAMTLIGYDNNKNGGSFLILNSWGSSWGKDGKVWVKYDDFFTYCPFAVSISKKRESLNFGSSPTIDKIEQPEETNINLSAPIYFQDEADPKWSIFLEK